MIRALRYRPVTLNEDEQVVLAVDGRVLPSLSDALWIFIFAPAAFLLPLLAVHHFFRPVTYLITTERILAFEPAGEVGSINLKDISKIKGTKTALLVSGSRNSLLLSRLPDAWFFETVTWKVIDSVRSLKDGLVK